MFLREIRSLTLQEAFDLYHERGLVYVVKDGQLKGMSIERK